MTTETCDQSLFSLFARAVEHRERTSHDRLGLAEIAAGQSLDACIMATRARTVLADLVELDAGRS
jgi:hypothetical protein